MKRKAIYLLYRVLQTIASPVILIYFILRGARDPRWLRTLISRTGALPPSWQQTVSASIWLHAVSVGEVLAAVPLIDDIRTRASRTPVFVSTTTLAGFETARKRLGCGQEATGDCRVFFAPFDFAWAVRRVLRRVRPSLLIVLETEIWPNMIREAARLGCGVAIVNGRISDRTAARYRRFQWFFSAVLQFCDRILTQSDEMSRRFIEAGAPAAIVRTAGNLKYDFTPAVMTPDSPIRAFLDAAPGQPIWIAASTSADDHIAEEDFVIEAQRQLENWRLILAPRKPERFAEAARLLDAAGLRYTRRTALADPGAPVLLLDSVGELSALFSHATVVFMGGTLADRGGHNILEPAVFGKPVIAGPHLENFRDIAAEFEKRSALCRIASGDELPGAILACSTDPGLGQRAREAAESQRGAAARASEAVMALYDSKYPSVRRPQPLHGILWLLSQIWKAGSELDRNRKLSYARRLPVPVVSVGNITAGGTGKTPMIIELLRGFAPSKPALLTRGYGRDTSDVVLLLNPDARVPVARTGDEPLLCHRGSHMPVGIGADRFAVGQRLIAERGIRLVFLDDGLQHLQLVRDFDLVMIDGLDPFGRGELLPLGRLREPIAGLARAKAFVIARSREATNLAAIEATLRRFNPTAPIFRSRVEVRQWVDSEGNRLPPSALEGVPAVGFCGLGNPETFWRTLTRTGVNLLDRFVWDDHHRYRPAEIRRLARFAIDIGANALLTTSKDAINIDPDYAAIIAPPLKLYWLEISLEIDRREELFDLIRAAVSSPRASPRAL